MSEFKPGVRVVVIDGDTHKIRKGVINTVYPSIKIAIVKFDDGNVEKVDFDYLGIESETEVQEEKPTEPVEKSEITITPNEFRKISVTLIAEETKEMPIIVGVAFSQFCAKLYEALFLDAVDNG